MTSRLYLGVLAGICVYASYVLGSQRLGVVGLGGVLGGRLGCIGVGVWGRLCDVSSVVGRFRGQRKERV